MGAGDINLHVNEAKACPIVTALGGLDPGPDSARPLTMEQLKPQELAELLGRLQMLCKEVGRTLLTCHLAELELLASQPLLKPKAVALQVPEFA